MIRAVFEGYSVSYECNAHGNVRWFLVNMFNNMMTDIPRNAHINSTTLYIDYVTSRNEGIYECQGEVDDYYEGTYNYVNFAARAILIGMLQH